MTNPMNKEVAMLIINDLLDNKNLEIHVIDESRPFNDSFDLILKINCKYRIDETDIWRENLKAWTLKRAGKPSFPTPFLDVFGDIQMSQDDGFVLPKAAYTRTKEDAQRAGDRITLQRHGVKDTEIFTDDLQKVGSHYKGEF